MNRTCSLFLTILGVAFGGSLAVAQMLPLDGVLVLGGGKAGSWDTSISVTNVLPTPIDIRIGPNNGCDPWFGGSCGVYARATIAPFATYVLASIPDNPYFFGPQALYVRHAASVAAPVVTAVVTDVGGTCERSMTLHGLSSAVSFLPGDLVFSGVTTNGEQYANLVLAILPPGGAPYSSEADVRVTIRDASGVEVGTTNYHITSDGAVVVVDFLSELGIPSFEGGSVTLSDASPRGTCCSNFEGLITLVSPIRALAIQGTRVPTQ